MRRGLNQVSLGLITGILCCLATIASGQSCDSLVPPNTGDPVSPGSGVVIEYGRERPVVDAVGWVVGIPSKILFWDRRALNHHVSDGTVAEVTDYLDRRHLNNTVVRVNQYAPLREWQRLTENRSIGPGWRYSVGTLRWLKYTFVPGRIFGKDEYNPYSNSLYLYSDMPVLGLAEAAYAKDVSSRAYPGTYAAIQELPLFSLWHETLATSEVQRYARVYGSSEGPNKIRHDLYARYGMEIAGSASQFIPEGSAVLSVAGAVGGHGVATWQNNNASR